jgi:hypothetical protein
MGMGNDGIIRWTISALERGVHGSGAIGGRATHAAGGGAIYRARAAITYRTCARCPASDTITLDSSLATAGHNTVEFADQHPIDDSGQLTTATLTCVVASTTATDNNT